MRSNFRRRLDNIYEWIEKQFRVYNRRKIIKKRIKSIKKPNFDFNKEYDDIVVPYWNKFGLKPDKMWFYLYSEGKDSIDPRYIPDDLYFGTILPYFSNMSFRRIIEDKCNHGMIFPDLLRPRTIAKNVAGIYYDGEGNIINRKTLKSICENENNFILKPSMDSGGGRLIEFYDSDVDGIHKLEKILYKYDCNFIIQEIVEQHQVLKQLNPSSLNTIRILSFLFKDKVHILSAIIRMGAKGQKVDNVSSGGIQCGLTLDGKLYDKAADNKRNWINKHPDSNVKFSEIKVPNFNSIINMVEQEHKKLGHFKLIGWDFAINKDGDPVFIEFNVCPGANQMTSGPTFGELTEEVLTDVFIDRTYIKANN